MTVQKQPGMKLDYELIYLESLLKYLAQTEQASPADIHLQGARAVAGVSAEKMMRKLTALLERMPYDKTI